MAPTLDLFERMVHRRAVQAVIWGMPAVNTDLMFQAMARAVLEVPPADVGSITGSIMDCWQTPLADVGPAGVDGGRGGRYLIQPPGHSEPLPEGFIPLASQTLQGYALLRSILRSTADADFTRALDYGKRIRLYPLSDLEQASETTYVDAAGILFDATFPYDIRFFESLDRVIQSQPWLERDKAMIDPLGTLGIEKGKRLAPDVRSREIMVDAGAAASIGPPGRLFAVAGTGHGV